VSVTSRGFEVARDLGDHRAGGHLLQALADDLAALLHLLDADDVAIEAVAERPHLAPADRDREVELGVDRIRLVAPDVALEPPAAQGRPPQVPVDRLLGGAPGAPPPALHASLIVR